MSRSIPELPILSLVTAGLLIATGMAPHDRFTWLLEVVWVLVGLPLLYITHARFPLTSLLYRLLFLHACLLIVGGYYTYERVPVGEWCQTWFGWQRNHYDRLGHFTQGFVPAIVTREILLRHRVITSRGWLFFLSSCVCLAFSASFEFLEWWAALAWGAGADAFLATQGDPWDTQWDMFLALLGSIVAQLTLTARHDRDLRQLSVLSATDTSEVTKYA